MKNKLIVLLALSLLCAAAATANATTASPPSSLKGFNSTKNVSVTYDKGAGTTFYGVMSQHTQGDKVFASTSAYGGIVSMTTTPGSMASTVPYVPSTPTDS